MYLWDRTPRSSKGLPDHFRTPSIPFFRPFRVQDAPGGSEFLETIPYGPGSLLEMNKMGAEKNRTPRYGKGEPDEGNGPLTRHIGRMGPAAGRCVALSGCFYLTQARPEGRGRVRQRNGQG